MACQCASAVTSEMIDWVALGGGNSGCCGNKLHNYGFHCPASAVPVSDYSRRHDPAGLYAAVNTSWACAGDFSHRNRADLRNRHVVLLARLMRGECPMICEFIGKPWPDKPVVYWARWAGVRTLARYTGAGHDHWSHISWYRSKADQRAYLWKPAPAKPPAKPPVKPPAKPPAKPPVKPPVKPPAKPPAKTVLAPRYPGYVMRYNPSKYDAHVKAWQTRMRSRGWKIGADGYFGTQTKNVVGAFQKQKRLGVDYAIGPITWQAAWTLPVT